MTESVQQKGRKISRKQRPDSGSDHVRQKTQDEVFMTIPERTREGSLLRQSSPSPTLVDDLDDEPEANEKPDVDEIKKKLYQRECSRLGITPVGAFLRSPTRTEISIRHYSLGPAGARALAVPLMLDSAMTHLDLEGNGIGDDGLASMSEMLMDHCGLSHLNLKRNNLKSKGATIICQVLQANQLIVSLCVAANEFDDRDGVVFADMLKENSHLKSLDLSDNRLGHVTGRHLGEALRQNDTLETLDLNWNQFREGGAADVMDGVKDNVTLKTLNLAFNSFGRGLCEKPYEALGQALATNTGLKSLDVSNNRLVDLDLVMVAKSLKSNEALKTLKIGHNLVGVKAAAILLKSLIMCENSGIKLLDLEDTPIATESLEDVRALEERGVKVVHGLVHQRETDFESEPRESRHEEAKTKAESEAENVDGNELVGTEVTKETRPASQEDVAVVNEGDTADYIPDGKVVRDALGEGAQEEVSEGVQEDVSQGLQEAVGEGVQEDVGEGVREDVVEAEDGQFKEEGSQEQTKVTAPEGNNDDVTSEQEVSDPDTINPKRSSEQEVSDSDTINPKRSSELEAMNIGEKSADENKVQSDPADPAASSDRDASASENDTTNDIASGGFVIGVNDTRSQNNDVTESSEPSVEADAIADRSDSRTIANEVSKNEDKQEINE